jgi:hypothetical protein
MAKKKTRAKTARREQRRGQGRKKAVPPPDNPWLRHQAEELAHGGGNEREQALARARALQQTREMPAADAGNDVSRKDET